MTPGASLAECTAATTGRPSPGYNGSKVAHRFGRFDDNVERDEGRFDQLAHCRSSSRVVDVVIAGP